MTTPASLQCSPHIIEWGGLLAALDDLRWLSTCLDGTARSGATTWTAALFSSLCRRCWHCSASEGRLDRVCAFLCRRPARWRISKSQSCVKSSLAYFAVEWYSLKSKISKGKSSSSLIFQNPRWLPPHIN